MLKEYDRIINEQLQNGIIEQVYPSLMEPHDQRLQRLQRVHCHECLYTGPSLTRDIIIKFRWYRIGIVSDVEKGFHMIHVDEKHRDALWFLWCRILIQKAVSF